MPISPAQLAGGHTAPFVMRRHRRLSHGHTASDANGSSTPTTNGHSVPTVNGNHGYEMSGDSTSGANGHDIPLMTGRQNLMTNGNTASLTNEHHGRTTNGHHNDAPSTLLNHELSFSNGGHISRVNVNGGLVNGDRDHEGSGNERTVNGRSDPRAILHGLPYMLSQQSQISYPQRQTSIGSIDWFISAIRAEILGMPVLSLPIP